MAHRIRAYGLPHRDAPDHQAHSLEVCSCWQVKFRRDVAKAERCQGSKRQLCLDQAVGGGVAVGRLRGQSCPGAVPVPIGGLVDDCQGESQTSTRNSIAMGSLRSQPLAQPLQSAHTDSSRGPKTQLARVAGAAGVRLVGGTEGAHAPAAFPRTGRLTLVVNTGSRSRPTCRLGCDLDKTFGVAPPAPGRRAGGA